LIWLAFFGCALPKNWQPQINAQKQGNWGWVWLAEMRLGFGGGFAHVNADTAVQNFYWLKKYGCT